MKIRIETPADYQAVEHLTYQTFHMMQKPGRGQCDEHLLIHKMRSVAAFIPKLSAVCERDGQLIGHIAYTKSKIVAADNTESETITFGPLSVLPKYQNSGVGSALINHTLTTARTLGYRAVLITGHPQYYARFGFVNAKQFHITLPDGTNMDAFMALPLIDGALDGLSGRWEYDPVFEIDPTELAQFNQQFGYN